jgi:Sec-independent protein translocase protein TatA
MLAWFGGMMGGGEALVVLVVALLLFGARLPKIARKVGYWVEHIRRRLGEVTDELQLDEEREVLSRKDASDESR